MVGMDDRGDNRNFALVPYPRHYTTRVAQKVNVEERRLRSDILRPPRAG